MQENQQQMKKVADVSVANADNSKAETKTEESSEKTLMTELIEWGKSILFALFIGGLLILFARPSLVIGASMNDTLHDKDLLLVEKISYILGEPKRGDIVICDTQLPLNDVMNKSIIKRVIGIEGDEITITDGVVWRNGKLLPEPYIGGVYTNGEGSWKVPKNKIFVLGDNRPYSNDSRNSEVGMIDFSDIKGKAYFRIYPFNKLGGLDNGSEQVND